jgi:hypothetical protein
MVNNYALRTPGMERSRSLPRFRAISQLVLAFAATACGDNPDQRAQPRITSRDPNVAEFVLELDIGRENGKSDEYEFASIVDVLIAPDGTMWVQDGDVIGSGQTPVIRLYNDQGRFLRQVGRVGDGPGEYRAPNGLTLLQDGRVIVRDYTRSDRLTLYAADGTLSTTWPLGQGYIWTYRGSDPIRADTAGFVWLPFRERPGRRQPSAYLRLRPDGTIADTVPFPRVPESDGARIEVTRTFPSGSTDKVGLLLPYAPRHAWAWSPLGSFVVTRTDSYQIEIHPVPRPGEARSNPPVIAEPAVIGRSVAPVEVSPAERAALRSRLAEKISAIRYGSYDGEVPEIPAHKPPIKSLFYANDTRLLVSVSMPSQQNGDEWSEPLAYDVFDREGQFMGRLILPDSFRLVGVAEDRAWGVFYGEDDVESIRRYRIVWPQRD